MVEVNQRAAVLEIRTKLAERGEEVGSGVGGRGGMMECWSLGVFG